MFKIGKFSQLVRVSPRMLRHYEKCGLFYPAEIDKVNGYRLYSASQIPLLLRIVALRDMGFSIEEISDILDSFEEKDYIEKVLNSKTNAIQASIEEENRKIQRLTAARQRIEKGNYTTTCQNVILKEIPKIKVLSHRAIVPDYSYQETLWTSLYNFIAENDFYRLLGEHVIAIYHETEYKEQDVDIEVAIAVKELSESKGDFIFKELDAIEFAATVLCDGPYEKILPEGEGVLARWIEDKGYEIIGSERGYGIRHPGNEQNSQNYQTEIQFPVQKKR
ncbi:MAG: transcriptional regulator, MerR family [Clostridia bacterium]|nr:transcriptional regulator, MerR family [Clostridia bacterium]